MSHLYQSFLPCEKMKWSRKLCHGSASVPSWSAGASDTDLKMLLELNGAGIIPGEANARCDMYEKSKSSAKRRAILLLNSEKALIITPEWKNPKMERRGKTGKQAASGVKVEFNR